LLGLKIEHLKPEDLWITGDPDDDWLVLAATDHVHRLGRDFVQANLERMGPSARWFMEFGLGVSIERYMAARRRRFEYARDIDKLLGADVVNLSPTVAATGFLADGRLSLQDEPGTLPDEVYNTNVANITGNPAISLPAGRCPNGVPFGLHVTAPRFRDGLLLDLAEAWEESQGWPLVAPGYDSFEVALGLSAKP
jgi:Asp-tRNA(Asn)/Glu-tRNA(Gln) amidotransferase A subunit family amidase